MFEYLTKNTEPPSNRPHQYTLERKSMSEYQLATPEKQLHRNPQPMRSRPASSSTPSPDVRDRLGNSGLNTLLRSRHSKPEQPREAAPTPAEQNRAGHLLDDFSPLFLVDPLSSLLWSAQRPIILMVLRRLLLTLSDPEIAAVLKRATGSQIPILIQALFEKQRIQSFILGMKFEETLMTILAPHLTLPTLWLAANQDRSGFFVWAAKVLNDIWHPGFGFLVGGGMAATIPWKVPIRVGIDEKVYILRKNSRVFKVTKAGRGTFGIETPGGSGDATFAAFARAGMRHNIIEEFEFPTNQEALLPFALQVASTFIEPTAFPGLITILIALCNPLSAEPYRRRLSVEVETFGEAAAQASSGVEGRWLKELLFAIAQLKTAAGLGFNYVPPASKNDPHQLTIQVKLAMAATTKAFGLLHMLLPNLLRRFINRVPAIPLPPRLDVEGTFSITGEIAHGESESNKAEWIHWKNWLLEGKTQPPDDVRPIGGSGSTIRIGGTIAESRDENASILSRMNIPTQFSIRERFQIGGILSRKHEVLYGGGPVKAKTGVSTTPIMGGQLITDMVLTKSILSLLVSWGSRFLNADTYDAEKLGNHIKKLFSSLKQMDILNVIFENGVFPLLLAQPFKEAKLILFLGSGIGGKWTAGRTSLSGRLEQMRTFECDLTEQMPVLVNLLYRMVEAHKNGKLLDLNELRPEIEDIFRSTQTTQETKKNKLH